MIKVAGSEKNINPRIPKQNKMSARICTHFFRFGLMAVLVFRVPAADCLDFQELFQAPDAAFTTIA